MKNESFWNNYIINLTKVKSDAKYFYNLALAATVRVITEACYDVINTGGGSSSTPVIRGVPSYQLVGGVPERKPKIEGRISLERMTELHHIRASSLLGFEPVEWRTPTTTLFVTRDALSRWNKANITSKEVAIELANLEDELILQFKKARAVGRKNFERLQTLEFPPHAAKLRQDCGLPDVSKDLENHSLFGLATFRAPTDEESSDPQKFKKYLEESEANTINSKLLSTTRCIALHKFLLEETSHRLRRRKLKEGIADLERMRRFITRTKKLPVERWAKSQIDMRAVDLDAARPTENVLTAR